MSLKKKWYSRGKIITVFILLLIVTGIVAGTLIYRHKLYYHYAVVKPGVLYRSGTLSSRGLEAVYGLTHFKTIVNLRSIAENNANKNGWYTRETDFCKKYRINHVNIPMNTSTPPTTSQIKKFFDIVNNPKMQPVIVHCEMGVIRTGMIIAAYRIAIMGEDNKTVFENMPLFGHDLLKEGEAEVEPFILGFKPK